MFTEEEKITLMTDIQVIKENVSDMKPQVKANTRLRLMVIGFCAIGLPLMGLTMGVLRMIK